jgi:WD40 repeat protein
MRRALFSALFLLGAGLLAAQAPRLVVPIGHTSSINSVAFSPDGTQTLTGSGDNTAKLWDLSGRELHTFDGHTDYVASVAFSPDGQRILTGSADSTAKLWDLSGNEIQTFRGHTGRVTSIAFSPDGQKVLTGSIDRTAKLWNLSGRVIQTFTERDAQGVSSAVFSPDGQKVLTGSENGTAKLWNLSGRVIQTFTEHPYEVSSVAFSPDGLKVLTGSWDVAKLWDLSGREIQTFTGHANEVFSVAFSPDGQKVLTGSGDGTAKLWDLSGKELQTFTGRATVVFSGAFSPDGQMVLTGSGDGTAKLWDLSGREIQTFTGHASHVLSVDFSPDGQKVLTGTGDGTAKLWDLSGRELLTFTGHASRVLSMAFSPDGQKVLTGSWDRTAKLWDLSGRELQTFKGRSAVVFSVAFSPDGQMVLTGRGDETAKLWDLSGIEIQTFTGHSSLVLSVAFSPDGQRVLTGRGDGMAKLWDLSGRALQTFKGHTQSVSSVAFSPDGQKILTGSGDGTAKLWDLSGRALQAFKGHTQSVSSVAFSPDGQKVLTGSRDNTAKLWDLSGQELQAFAGHAASVRSVAFSPDGQMVLTGSEDNTAKLWDTNSGQCLATLIAIDSADWVVTTLSGLFDASPNAMRLMHYVVGTEAVDMEQLKERFYEPGLLAKITGHSQEPIRSVAGLDTVGLYPVVMLELDTLKSILRIRLSARSGGVGKVSVFVNGKEIVEDANPPKGADNLRETDFSIDLERYERFFLPDTLNFVTVRAYNADNWLKSAPHEVSYVPVFARAKGGDGQPASGAAPERRSRRPALHIILIGTADYEGKALDLKYAAKDAADMASALRQTGELLFKPGNVFVHLLSTDPGQTPPTKANIKAAFDAVEKAAKAEDILITYFSGHGITYGDADRALFYYLTMDIATPNLSDAGIRATRAISSNELTEWTKKIPALKQVMILDACNSGKVAESILAAGEKSLASTQIRALDRMKDRTGMYVLTGSAADMVSYEAGRFGQSLLTYSLLDGIIRFMDEKEVDVMKLFQGARDRVPGLAAEIGGIQTPMMAFPVGAASFPIGIVDTSVKIVLQQPKPVFIRNAFQDEDIFDDELGLTQALADYFRSLTAKGAQAELIYVDVSEYQNAYSIKGLYKVRGDTVEVRGRLFKGNTRVGAPFTLKGNKSDVPGLVEEMVGMVTEMVNRN